MIDSPASMAELRKAMDCVTILEGHKPDCEKLSEKQRSHCGIVLNKLGLLYLAHGDSIASLDCFSGAPEVRADERSPNVQLPASPWAA